MNNMHFTCPIIWRYQCVRKHRTVFVYSRLFYDEFRAKHPKFYIGLKGMMDNGK